MADPFHARIRRDENVAVLAIGGDIGPFAQTKIRALLGEAFAEPAPSDFVLDLTAVTFIDHHGLAVVEFARRVANAQGIGFSLIAGPAVEVAQRETHPPERRVARSPSGPGSIFVDCRLCWRRIKLQPERVEIVDGRVVYRCQHCDAPFLVRSDDAASLGITGS
jgi:anti-anti-sigma factor